MGEAEDVVDEEQHVLILFVAEILRHGEGRKSDAHTGTRRLVHLAVNERHLGLGDVLLIDDAGFRHFVVEVITFTGTLPHPGKHRITTVGFRDVIDELHDHHGLAHAGTTEGAHFTTLGEGSDQIDDLDAGLEDVGLGVLIDEGRSRTVNRVAFFVGHVAALIHGIAGDVEDATEHAFADGNGDGRTAVHHFHAALEAFGGRHGDGTGDAVPQMLLHLEGEVLGLAIHLEGDGKSLVDGRHAARGELHVDNGADNLDDFAGITHDGRVMKRMG